MPTPDAAWKHTRQTNGNQQNQTPDAHGRTPANIIAQNNPYTAGQLTTVSTDNSSYVANIKNHVVNTTGRSNHLYEYTVPAGILIGASDLQRFRCSTTGTFTNNTQRLYIWNATLLSWEQLDSEASLNNPRTMEGAANGPTFTDYVDGAGKLYTLCWDYEGVFQSPPGGGCIHEAALIETPAGPVPVASLKLRAEVLCWLEGERVTGQVYYTCKHAAREWPMVYITTSAGRVGVTSDHEVPTETGTLPASAVTVAHKVLGPGGSWLSVDLIETASETLAVYDVLARVSIAGEASAIAGAIYADGVGVGVMP